MPGRDGINKIVASNSNMKNALVIFSFLICSSCASPGQVSVNTPQNMFRQYPIEYSASATARSEIEGAWKSFCSENALSFAAPEFDSITNTPLSLPQGLSGKVLLTEKKQIASELELRESLRSFIQKNSFLLFSDHDFETTGLGNLTLVSFSRELRRKPVLETDVYQAVYHQTSYNYPIENGYGVLRLSIAANGLLMQVNSRLIPRYNLSEQTLLPASEIIDKILGNEYQISLPNGQRLSITPVRKDEASLKGLVIYPKPAGQRLAIHLAYVVRIGNGKSWSVFVDALTGENLGSKPDFNY